MMHQNSLSLRIPALDTAGTPVRPLKYFIFCQFLPRDAYSTHMYSVVSATKQSSSKLRNEPNCFRYRGRRGFIGLSCVIREFDCFKNKDISICIFQTLKLADFYNFFLHSVVTDEHQNHQSEFSHTAPQNGYS